MNLTLNDLAAHGHASDRRKIGSSLADVDPMNIDKTVRISLCNRRLVPGLILLLKARLFSRKFFV